MLPLLSRQNDGLVGSVIVDSCCDCYRPLKRMTVGMFLAALAFVAAGLVQVQIDVSKHTVITHDLYV